MLTWNESTRRDQSGKVVSVSYTAQIPHWGRASIHPHIHHPGELFLNCPALGISIFVTLVSRKTLEENLQFVI